MESHIGYCATTVLGSVITSAAYLISSFMGSYGWILLVLGFVCGSAAGLCIHSSFCVLYKYFSPEHQTKASSVMSTGASIATIFLSISYEKLVPTFGWRTTLQVTSVFTAVLAIPASFAIRPGLDIVRNKMEMKQVATTDCGTLEGPEESFSYKTAKPDNVHAEAPCEEESSLHSWLKMCYIWRVWLILFALLLPAMCWSVYWVNIISYFESITIPEHDILLFVMVMTINDLLGRILLVFFIQKIPFGETSLLCFCNFLLFAVTVFFVLFPSTPVLFICSVFIGVGRGWYNILPYRVSVDLLESDKSDQGITLAMIALGVGFTVGTLPAGAIYDVTSSYTYAFLINAILFLLGALILLFLQVERRVRSKRERKRGGWTAVHSSTSRECVDTIAT